MTDDCRVSTVLLVWKYVDFKRENMGAFAFSDNKLKNEKMLLVT